MIEFLSIVGEKKLSGDVSVSGAKNAALPLIIASLLSSKEIVLDNVPDLYDINVLLRLLKSFGAEYIFSGKRVEIEIPKIKATQAPYWLVKALRASFWVLGPLLARAKSAHVALPGGDAIGTRPVDLHLRGLTQFGADIRLSHGVVSATVPDKLRPARIELAYPSVGATHHLLMTAALIPGRTILKGAAREPEVVAVCEMLQKMGAEIDGIGEAELSILGQEELNGCEFEVLGDRIEAATYLLAGAATKGHVRVTGISSQELGALVGVLTECGCKVAIENRAVSVIGSETINSIAIETAPFPGLATDIQPMLLALLTKAQGESRIVETVFENRFGHVAEYRRFGAQVTLDGREALIRGVPKLSGAPVEALDIRAAAGLLIMALMAEGNTEITELHHFDRGYENLVEKFRGLGASISRVPTYGQRELVIGC